MNLLVSVLLLVTLSSARKSPDNLAATIRKTVERRPPPEDLTPSVVAEVIQQLSGGLDGDCHVVVYYDKKTVGPMQLQDLQDMLGVPVTLLDVSQLKFGLLTAKGDAKQTLPIVNLLTAEKETDRCRIILSWSASHFQKGLLILARFQDGLLRKKDTILFVTHDEKLNGFIPEIKNRVIIRKVNKRNSKQGLSDTNFIIERSCQECSGRQVRRVGEYGSLQGLEWFGKQLRHDMNKENLIISYTDSLPNIFEVNNSTFDGVEYRMLNYASKVLNFTYTLVKPDDGQWGSYVNSSWTGKVGDVVYKRADLAIGGIVYQSLRAKFTSYSVMFHHELWGIVCPPPARMPLWPNIGFPFRSAAAQSILSFLIVIHAAAFIIVTFMSTIEDENRMTETHPLGQSIQTVFRTALAFYFRLLACVYFWNLFYCIMKPQYEASINSSEDLLRSSKQFGLVKGTTVESVLSNSLNVYHREMILSSLPLASISEGLRSVERDGMCIVGVPKRYSKSTITTRYTTRCGEAAIQVSLEDLHTVLGGWIMLPKSQLKELLDPIIMRMQGFGLIEKWVEDLYVTLSKKRKEKLPCIRQPHGPLTLQNLRLAFLLIFGGCAMSVVMFLVEHVVVYLLSFCRGAVIVNARRPAKNTPNAWSESVKSQRLWKHEQTAREIMMREAMFRRHINLLLRNSPECDKSTVSSVARSPSGVDEDTRAVENSQFDQSFASTSSHNAHSSFASTNRSSFLISSKDSDLSHDETTVTEVTVRPYQTRLERAVQLLPWDHQRPSSTLSGEVRFPEAPDSPPPRLPPLKEPVEGSPGREQAKLNQATLHEVNEESIDAIECTNFTSSKQSDFYKTMRSIFSPTPSIKGKTGYLEEESDSEGDNVKKKDLDMYLGGYK